MEDDEMSEKEMMKRLNMAKPLEQQEFDDLEDLVNCMYLEDAKKREEADRRKHEDEKRQAEEKEKQRVADEVRRAKEEEERRGRVEEQKINRLQTLLSIDGRQSLGILLPASSSGLDESVLTPTGSEPGSPLCDSGGGSLRSPGRAVTSPLRNGGVRFDASDTVTGGSESHLSMTDVVSAAAAGEQSEVISLAFSPAVNSNLEVPQDLLVTKYDYSRFRKERFEFFHFVKPEHNHGDFIPSLDDEPDLVISDETPPDDEPETGSLSPEFDVAAYQATRASIPWVDYVPYVCTVEGRPMGPLDEYEQDDRLEGPEYLPLMKTLASRKRYYTSDYEYTKKALASFWSKLKPYRNLEVLIVKDAGLTKADFRLPALLYCDLSGNPLANEKSLVKSLSYSPRMQVLNVAGTPMTAAVPDIRRKLIGACPRLVSLDGDDVQLAERLVSIGMYGSKLAKQHLSLLHWDYCFSALEDMADMMQGGRFQPEQVTRLELVGLGLRSFHVGPFKRLQELSLAENLLTTLEGGGLEQCDVLEQADFSRNHIMRTDALQPLAYIPKLKAVRLDGNSDPRDAAKEFAHYRLFVIFITRNLAGTNRAPGIAEIDGEPVSVGERAEAVRRIRSAKDRVDPGLYAWVIHLINYYGHKQVYSQQFTSMVAHLRMPDSGLTWADLHSFPALEVVDLSGNLLGKDIYFLDTLKNLRMLNLSGNVKLDLPVVLDQLRKVSTLEQINLCVAVKGHKYHPDNSKYRLQVLSVLMQSSPDVRWLDTRFVTLDERVQAVALALPEMADRYRFGLAVLVSVLPHESKSSSRIDEQEDLPTNDEHEPEEGEEESKEEEEEEEDDEPNSKSEQKEEPIKTKLPKSKKGGGEGEEEGEGKKRKPSSTPKKKAGEVVKIGEGKKAGAEKAKGRKREKKAVVREEVDVAREDPMTKRRYAVERVVALGSGDSAQYAAASVTSLLRMDGWGLTNAMCTFGVFVQLEELNLSGNQLTGLDGMGLETLAHLRVLDVTHNAIKLAAKKLALSVDQLRSLECLALHGNPCMRGERYRAQLIGSLEVMKQVTCPLRVIDTDVSIEERLESWRKAGGTEAEVELLRYNIVMSQQIPAGMDNGAVQSLDLSCSGFKQVDVSSFLALQVLILRGNQLTTLANSGIPQLTKLKALDLRDNQLAKMDEVARLVAELPGLVNLGIAGNKFSPVGKDTTWRHKFIGLLPMLRERYVPLHAIDERPITVAEIAKAWAEADKRAEDSPNFRFRILLLRKMPEDTYRDDIIELDLSNNELPLVDMEGFYKLERMSLAGNLLTSLDRTGLAGLHRLRALDLSNNRLANLAHVCGYLKDCRVLENLSLAGNPCASDRAKIVAGFLAHWDAATMPLKVLDGRRITIEEICTGLRSLKTMEDYEIERLRLHLAFQQAGASRETMQVSFQNVGLQGVAGLEQLPLLSTLDLSNNNLRSLDPLVMKQLPELFELDLRNNDFANLKTVLDGLAECKSLTIVYLENCTRASKETAQPRKYLAAVCKQLRWLELVDGLRNPYGNGGGMTSNASFALSAQDSLEIDLADSASSAVSKPSVGSRTSSASSQLDASSKPLPAKKPALSKKASAGGARPAPKKAAGGGTKTQNKFSAKGSMRLHKTKAAAVSKALEEPPLEESAVVLDHDQWLSQQKGRADRQKFDWKSTFASDSVDIDASIEDLDVDQSEI